MLRTTALIAALLTPGVLHAQTATRSYLGEGERTAVIGTASAGVATNTTPRTTSCINVRGSNYLNLDAEVTRSAGTLDGSTVTCKHYRLAACADTVPKDVLRCSGGACSVYSDAVAVSATLLGWSHRVDVAGFWSVKCSFAFTNGGATDTIKVYAMPTRE